MSGDNSYYTATTCAQAPLIYPQKEFLQFSVDIPNLSPDYVAVVEHIQQVAEQVLFHWKTFPIVLPKPIAVEWDKDYGYNNYPDVKTRPIMLRDAFIPPSFDELDAVAVDSKGDPKLLQKEHLSSIRENGQFSVASLHFPQQKHVWQLSQWLQKGCINTLQTLFNDIAHAVALLAVVAKERITGEVFSLWHALRSSWKGIVMITDLLFGVPWLSSEHLSLRLLEERCAHLVQELSVKNGDVNDVCRWLIEQVKRVSIEKVSPLNSTSKQPSLPYVFVTPQGHQVDLRLFNKDVMNAAVPHLVTILEKEARGWFLHFREKTIARLRTEGLTDVEVEKAACEAVQEEYINRVCAAVESHPRLQDMAGPGTAALFCAQARAVTLMQRALVDAKLSYINSSKSYEEGLQTSYPILSRVRRWRETKIKEKQNQLLQESKWKPHAQALAACREAGLHQHAYFLHRDLAFMKERAPVLQNELQSLKVPSREYEWRSQIMTPERYVVRRTFQGTSEVIPTVLSSVPTSITAPRSPHQPGYVLQKQTVRVTSTRWPMWRLCNLWHRSVAWTCNALFLFALWIPLCSPISLRALFCKQPFMPDYELSQVNGAVCPSRASLTLTLTHRLHNLWRQIAKSRTHFESSPDTGFIGKGVSRHLNRIYNYILKGFCGTLFYVIIFPLVSIVVSLLSFLVALLAPLWVPCLVLMVTLVCPIFYDWDAPVPGRKWFPYPRALLWHILICGMVQPVILSIVIVIVCPLMAALGITLAVLRYSIRSVWDWLLFEGIIRKRGRIPAANSCLVKRIAGPGLHHQYCYQISSEQALAAFEARLEEEMLKAYQKQLEEQIALPLRTYNNFLKLIFEPFSGGASVAGGGYERVSREVRDLHRSLQDKVDTRRRELQCGLPSDIRTRLKLTTRELKATLKQATLMIEQFYPQTMFPLLVTGSPQQPSSEQQSRIDSGISTGGDIEEVCSSGTSITPHGRGALRGATLSPGPSAVRTHSLVGQGELRPSGVSGALRGGIRAGRGAVPLSDHSQSQHFTRERSLEDGPSDAAEMGNRNASEGAELDHRSRLRRDISSFDCERGLIGSGGEPPQVTQSEEKLLLSCASTEEGLEDVKVDTSPVNRADVQSQETRCSYLTLANVAEEGEQTTSDNNRNKFSSEEAWWDSRGLQCGDYASLAAIILTEIFSPDILTPMDDEDTTFQIESQGISLTRYTAMLSSAPHRPDLDPLLTVHAPRSNNIRVPPPYFDVTNFLPPVRHSPAMPFKMRSGDGAISRAAMWGTSIAERLSLRVAKQKNSASRNTSVPGIPYESPLMVPPPVPHPAVIAVIIYNREANEPIVLSSSNTQNVLMAMEDSVRRNSSGTASLDESSGDSSPPSSPPSLYDEGITTYTPKEAGNGDSRTATLPLSAVLDMPSTSGTRDKDNKSPHSLSGEEEPQSFGPFGVIDPNPLRSLLESHPPFTVALDLAPPEDPPENDYEDSLRTLHAPSDSLDSRKSYSSYPTAV